MLRYLGYACIALDSGATTTRGTVLRNATPARLRELITANLAGLREVLLYNARLDIHLFRLSSDIIPFWSHPVNTIAWWEEWADELAALGALARATGQRLSLHPSQYTILNALDPKVSAGALRDLEAHDRLLTALGFGPEAQLVTHIGGVYGDRAAALDRFVATVAALPAGVRARLIVENDDRLWTAEEALLASARTGVPVVFDWLHHRCLPGRRDPDDSADLRDLLGRFVETWAGRPMPPKAHFSSQAAGQKPGAHADDIDPVEFRRFLDVMAPWTFDCMLEAKAKDRALLKLRTDLGLAHMPAAKPIAASGSAG